MCKFKMYGVMVGYVYVSWSDDPSKVGSHVLMDFLLLKHGLWLQLVHYVPVDIKEISAIKKPFILLRFHWLKIQGEHRRVNFLCFMISEASWKAWRRRYGIFCELPQVFDVRPLLLGSLKQLEAGSSAAWATGTVQCGLLIAPGWRQRSLVSYTGTQGRSQGTARPVEPVSPFLTKFYKPCTSLPMLYLC